MQEFSPAETYFLIIQNYIVKLPRLEGVTYKKTVQCLRL